MEKFIKLKSIPAHIPLMNIDTDMIIPKQFLKTIKRTGLGKSLFYEMRYDESGKLIDKFILNNDPYSKSKILLAGKNFGCGSSREHAVWALKDYGIKCLIGTEFADIFYNNCFKNGVLPIILDSKNVENIVKIISFIKTSELEIDLENQFIKTKKNQTINFEILPYLKKNLLEGIDDISKTLEKKDLIDKFENSMKKNYPWLNKKNG